MERNEEKCMVHLRMYKFIGQEPGRLQNTFSYTRIDGRHPIDAYLSLLKKSQYVGLKRIELEFVTYVQSRQVMNGGHNSIR